MTDIDLPMVARFYRHRWSQERIDIHDLVVGGERSFQGDKQYLWQTVARLNDAYELTREWSIRQSDRVIPGVEN